MATRNLGLLGYVLLQSLTLSLSHGQVPGVLEAIEKIDPHTPTAIKFELGEGLPKGGHLQGVQWLQRNDKQFLLLSGSSDTFSYFLTVPLQGPGHHSATLTQLLASPFRHAGGFQMIEGRFAAVGLEDNETKDVSKVWIVDTAAEQPHKRPRPLIEIERRGEVERATAGAVAIAGRHLVVGTWDSATLDFYESNGLGFDDDRCQYTKRDTWSATEADRSEWVDADYGSYQNLNLIIDAKGTHFLVGFCRAGAIDRLDVYDFLTDRSTPLPQRVIKRASKRFHCAKTTFQAGAGLRVMKDGSLRVYACAHRDGVVEVFE